MLIQIPVSLGELVDKITILSIKTRHLSGDALVNVQRHLVLLEGVLCSCGADLQPQERAALQAVNEELWRIEDAIRLEESKQCFGAAFIALARSVYQRNDERAALKRAINERHGSTLVEEKSYTSN